MASMAAEATFPEKSIFRPMPGAHQVYDVTMVFEIPQPCQSPTPASFLQSGACSFSHQWDGFFKAL